MKKLFYAFPILWIFIPILFFSCSEEPILYELSEGDVISFRIDPDPTSYFRSYQTAPEMGGLSELYYGQRDGFSEIYSLVEVYPISAPFFLDTTYSSDSTSYYFVDSIESVTFSLTLENAGDSLSSPELVYFSGDGDTTIFLENESSFYTVNSTLDTIGFDSPISSTDTLENVHFLFDVDSLFNNYMLDTTRLSSYTFKINGDGEINSLVAFTNPRLEVHYLINNVIPDDVGDSTWIDTVTFTFTAKYELTIVDPGIWAEDTTFSIGRAKGVKSILRFNLDTLSMLPDNIIFKDADLYLKCDTIINSFKVFAYPLKDSISINDIDLFSVEQMDTTVLEFIGATFSTVDSLLILNVRDFVNYIYLNQLTHYELQLSSSTGNDPFSTLTFINSEPFKPYIIMRYVATN
tara:strand:- start:4254 stop:5471 length:1218 start_codon:yes stop_codon:yes gene_type:complete